MVNTSGLMVLEEYVCGEGGDDAGGGWVKREVVVKEEVGEGVKCDRCDEVACEITSISAICQAIWNNFAMVEGPNGRRVFLHLFCDVGGYCRV